MSKAPVRTRTLNQTSVIWMCGDQSWDGSYTYSDPVEISSRWEDKIELIKTADGREVVSNARVFVDRDITQDSYIYLGTLSDVGTTQPQNLDGARLVIMFTDIPNLRNTERLLSVRL